MTMRAEALKGHLDGLLLAVVAEEPAHGYAIVERLRDRSGGAFDLPEGTVYPALHRLEQAGLLKSSWAPGTTRTPPTISGEPGSPSRSFHCLALKMT
jgi:DNA-binding PadR family transcriptional regulator